ncbi:YaaC family protein [Aquibacillus sediminis]|uniref:YaaC family protein n=1 Tax=Aquibacillus sediminis TaxID=2574734 RepID=UPI001109C179|nr:YaaC family protein [Aquibacillus sediminis]
MLQQQVLNFMNYLKSAHTSQKYLEHTYKKYDVVDPEKNSYQNSYRFLYYLQHGQHFYQTGNQANLIVQPILFFYGMVHLLKACLLTRRPDYPENTSMLAHGVSTRKRKKQQYEFLQDEVKLQHKGLFPYFTKHLCGVEKFPYEKVTMKQLLAAIPEVNSLFNLYSGESVLLPVASKGSYTLSIPRKILDNYHMTENAFLTKLSSYQLTIAEKQLHKETIELSVENELSPISKGPFFYHSAEETFYLPASREYFSTNHEIMNHYLLLYNLSMICRYETEWWGDLLHTLPTVDYPFIETFLQATSEKVPFLLGYFLYQQYDT